METGEYLAQLKGTETAFQEKIDRFKDSKDSWEVAARERAKKNLEVVKQEIKKLSAKK